MKMLSFNLKVSIVLSIFILSSIFITVIGLNEMKVVNHHMHDIVDTKFKKVQNAKDVQIHLYALMQNEMNYLLSDNKNDKVIIEKKMNNTHKKMLADLKIAKEFSSNEEKQDILKFSQSYHQWWDEFNNINQSGKTIHDILAGNREFRMNARISINKYIKANTLLMEKEVEESEKIYEVSRWSLIVISFASSLFGLILAFIILRKLNATINNVVETLTNNSFEVSTASKQIAASSQDLAQATTEQSTSLEQTASAIIQLNSTVQRNSETTYETSELIKSGHKKVLEGNDVMNEMKVAMKEIIVSNDEVLVKIDHSNEQMNEVIAVINEINEKTKVINDIVFQTKLLSFNASVEAARAGESGKGFSVVANEIGALAKMSGDAASEIETLLEASIDRVENIVDSTKTEVSQIISNAKSKVERGREIANTCQFIFDEIVENMKEVNLKSEMISQATSEQAQGIDEITQAINVLEQTTQTNASGTEQAASTALQLSDQAKELNLTVIELGIVINGQKATTTQKEPEALASSSFRKSKLQLVS